MSPNLFVLAKTLCHPQSWFHEQQAPKDLNIVQYCREPVPGMYRHVLRGWLLVATKSNPEATVCDVKVEPPMPVVYSRVLKRFIFESEFRDRCRQGRVKGRPHWQKGVKFFRLDDGITWVNCFDHDGDFLPGPWQRFCLDKDKDEFRPMLKGDGKYGDDERWLACQSEERKGSKNSNRTASTRGNSVDGTKERSSKSSSTIWSESPVQSRTTSIASTMQIDKDSW